MDDEYYLEPGFDPQTLKVAELRGILLRHDIDYPSSAKKADLVDIFTRHLSSQATNLRAASSRVKPSARGMVNAGDPNVLDFITPAKGRRSTSRRLTAAPQSDDDDSIAAGRRSVSARKTPARKSATPAEFGSVRSTRRSSVLPHHHMQQESVGDADAETDGTESTDGPFSSYNPFQSGSSPATVGRTPGRSVRKVWDDADRTLRQSMPAPSATTRRSSGSRRRTEIGLGAVSPPVDEDYYGEPVRRRKEQQLAMIPSQTYDDGVIVKKEEPDYDFEPGEEFVPEEAAELARLPQQELARREPRPRRGGGGIGALWLVFTFVALAYGIWWRNEKVEAGYCGVGGLGEDHESSDALTTLLRPECEPCPPHARCYPGFTLECDNDYIKVNKWSSLGGLLPIPPDCLPDTEKERRKSIMSNAALEILRENGAEQRCKERFLRSDMPIEGVSEEDLRQVLYDRKAASLSDREFNELWRLALEDVASRDEVIDETDESSATTALSTDPPEEEHSSPLHLQPCRLVAPSASSSPDPWPSIAALLVIISAKLCAQGIILALIATLYAQSTLAARRTYNSQVTRLIHISLRHLSRNAIEHPEHPYIAVAHLRDQVLRHEFDPKKRAKLWQGVEKVVELNSNVRAGEKEIQGEIMRVWTWIGGRYVESAPERKLLESGEGKVKEEEEDWEEEPRILA